MGKTWVCPCGWKTGSARGWKKHAAECEYRRYYIQEAVDRLNGSLAGQSFKTITGSEMSMALGTALLNKP